VKRTVSGDGEFRAVRVEYTTGGQHRRLTIRWALRLCGPPATTADACGAASPP
jgi:hypothetical protein